MSNTELISQFPEMSYKAIENILAEKASNAIHAFRSGGGLRVLRLECGDDLLGYGESIQFDEALKNLENDTAAGGRKYNEVYGKLTPHYLTGTSEVSSNIDRWLLMGRSFDIRNFHFGDEPYEFKSEFSSDLDFKQYHQAALDSTTPVIFEKDGITYQFSKSSGKVLINKSGLDPWIRRCTITYRAPTFSNLLSLVNDKLNYWFKKT